MPDDGRTRAAAGGDTVDHAQRQDGAHEGPAVLVTTRSDRAVLCSTPGWKAEMVRTGRVIFR